MTIEYKDERISEDITIQVNRAMPYLYYTALTATSLELKPVPEGNHGQDKVTINFYGRKPARLTDSQINNSGICKKNGVIWKPE